MSQTLANTFNVEHHEIVSASKELPIVAETPEQEDGDFDVAREIQHELLDQGRAAINTAMRIAAESENPRARFV